MNAKLNRLNDAAAERQKAREIFMKSQRAHANATREQMMRADLTASCTVNTTARQQLF